MFESPVSVVEAGAPILGTSDNDRVGPTSHRQHGGGHQEDESFSEIEAHRHSVSMGNVEYLQVDGTKMFYAEVRQWVSREGWWGSYRGTATTWYSICEGQHWPELTISVEG